MHNRQSTNIPASIEQSITQPLQFNTEAVSEFQLATDPQKILLEYIQQQNQEIKKQQQRISDLQQLLLLEQLKNAELEQKNAKLQGKMQLEQQKNKDLHKENVSLQAKNERLQKNKIELRTRNDELIKEIQQQRKKQKANPDLTSTVNVQPFPVFRQEAPVLSGSFTANNANPLVSPIGLLGLFSPEKLIERDLDIYTNLSPSKLYKPGENLT